MPGDPANIRHAPINIGGMNVLVVLRGTRNVREIPASPMLATFRLAGGPAGVHQKQWSFRIQRHGLNDLVPIIFENIFNEEVAASNYLAFGTEVAGIALPDQNLIDVLALFLRGFNGDVRS